MTSLGNFAIVARCAFLGNMEHYTAQIFNIGNSIIDYALTIEWPRVIFRFKVFSFVLSGLAFAAIIWTLKKHREVLVRAAQEMEQVAAKVAEDKQSREEKKYLNEEWDRIKKLWLSHSSEEKRLALIEADAALDNSLRQQGAEGESLSERMAHPASPRLTNTAEVAFAHTFRNELVHEIGAVFDQVDAERAFKAYESALKELKVI